MSTSAFDSVELGQAEVDLAAAPASGASSNAGDEKTSPDLRVALAERPRALGLDALRGLAILLMCLSGLVPRYLPNWMYHGYYPQYMPADEVAGLGFSTAWERVENPWRFAQDWPSYTWVDWVFPMFLFAMGAAFPLALRPRKDKGISNAKLIRGILWRGVVLMAFAVYVLQIAPGFIAGKYPDTVKPWWLALLGFMLLFPVFVQLPKKWAKANFWRGVVPIRLLGVAACIGLVAYIQSNRDGNFAWSQNDIIILLLAHMSIAGALLWLLTSFRTGPKQSMVRAWAARLGIGLPIAWLAHQMAMKQEWRMFPGTLQSQLQGADAIWQKVYNNLPGVKGEGHFELTGSFASDVLQAPKRLGDGLSNWATELTGNDTVGALANIGGLYDFTWYKFLWIVVPGTIVGDILHRYLQQRRELQEQAQEQAHTQNEANQAAEIVAGSSSSGAWKIWLASLALTASLILPLVALWYHRGVLFASEVASASDGAEGWWIRLTWSPVLAAGALLLIGVAAWALLPNKTTSSDSADAMAKRFHLQILGWGGVILALGLLVEPFEGGISKGPPATLSWYLVSLGMSIVALSWLTLIIETSRAGRVLMAPLIANGQNPMLAYVAIRNLLAPLTALPLFGWLATLLTNESTTASSLNNIVTELYLTTEWGNFGWGVIKTLMLAGIVVWFTKWRVIWRS